MTPKTELAMYWTVCRRGKTPNLYYDEFLAAAREVVAEIPVEAVTPIEEMLDRLEVRILERRRRKFPKQAG